MNEYLGYSLFFSQNLVNLFPHESNNINILSDLLMSDKLTKKEREEKFYELQSEKIEIY